MITHLKSSSHRIFASSHLRIFAFLHLRILSSHLIVASYRRILSSRHLVMILSSSFEDRTFDEFEHLLRFLNEHVGSEEYAIVQKRSKNFKLRTKCKTWLICDRERKSHECTEQNRRHVNSRHIECSFFIVAKLNDENADSWIYEIKNEEHNYASSIIDVHSALRRMTMTREMKIEIKRQLTVQIIVSREMKEI